MSDQYLLPCECGNKLTVETTQAGQDLKCSACGVSVEVPSFSKVKRLQRAESAAPEKETKSKGTKTKRSQSQAILFAFGLVVLFAGLIATGVFWSLSNRFYAEPPTISQEDMEGLTRFVESASPAILDAAWHEKVVTDIPDADDFQPHSYHTHKLLFEHYRNFALISASVAGVGLLLLAGSFLIPAKSQKQRPRK